MKLSDDAKMNWSVGATISIVVLGVFVAINFILLAIWEINKLGSLLFSTWDQHFKN